MNQINCTLLIVFLTATSGCYQKSPPSDIKSTQTVTTNSSPAAIEKSVEPTEPATSASGDYAAAVNFYNPQDYQKAIAELEAVIRKDAKNQPAQLYLGRSLLAFKYPDAAIGAYKTAIELKPDDAEANYELGKIYLNKKDYETSLRYIEKAAKINYTSTDYLIALGDTYRELKKCDYAVVPYDKVNGFDDKNTAAYYGMGLCYIELKNRIAAGQQVRNLEKLDANLAQKLAAQIPK